MSNSLALALVGTGRMGRAVADLVERDGRHRIVATFDAENPLLDARDPDELNGADLVIDFSAPDVALDHMHRYGFWGVSAVVGTTGWYDDLDRVRDWVEEGQIGLLYAPNFSLGVATLVRALRAALPLLERQAELDVAVHETHHTGKVDSPGGTALLLANTLLDGLSRKTRLETETIHGRPDPAALHVTAQRLGTVFGEHTVSVDGPHDALTFAHRAKSREAFAAGALRAAEWLHGRSGLFTLDDMLAEWEKVGRLGSREVGK